MVEQTAWCACKDLIEALLVPDAFTTILENGSKLEDIVFSGTVAFPMENGKTVTQQIHHADLKSIAQNLYQATFNSELGRQHPESLRTVLFAVTILDEQGPRIIQFTGDFVELVALVLMLRSEAQNAYSSGDEKAGSYARGGAKQASYPTA